MRKGRFTPYIFLLPYAAAFLAFLVFPIGYSVYMSLFVTRGRVSRFVGLQNYEKALKDTAFWSGIGNIAIYAVCMIGIMIVLALILALFLDSTKIRCKAVFRMIYFLPYAVPGVIAAIMWGFMYSPSLNTALSLFAPLNGGQPLNLLTTDKLMLGIVNISLWLWTGYNMTIYYANLTSIPVDIYEAAKIDGCGEIGVALYIKVPMIASAVKMTVALTIIGAIQVFNEPFMMGNITIVPSTYTPNMYVYNMAFSYGNLPYSATLSVVLTLITILVSVVFNLLTREKKGGIGR